MNVAETKTFKAQLKAVTKAIARPLIEGGKISLSKIHVIGPKPNE